MPGSTRSKTDAERIAQLAEIAKSTGRPIIGKTASEGSYPTAAMKFVAVQPIALWGDEEEGATVTDEDYGALIHAASLDVPPPVGTRVIIEYVPHRFVITGTPCATS